MDDSDKQTNEAYLEMIRRLTPWERLLRTFDLSDSLRQLSLERIKIQHPDVPAEELRRLFVEQIYGAEFAVWLKQR